MTTARPAKRSVRLNAALRAIAPAVAFCLLSVLPAAAQSPAAAQTAAPFESSVGSATPLETSTGAFDLPILPFLPFSPLQPFASPFVAHPQRTGRLFGFIPNYATVEGGATSQGVLTKGDKFRLTLQGAFDPYEFMIVAGLAGFSQAQNDDPSFGQGFSGYAKRYAVGFADQAIGNVMTGAVFPVLLRQDPRYFQRNHGGFLRRFAYAGSKIFVARSDSGRNEFNYSEFAGNGAAAVLSNLYEPASSRTLANTLSTWETQIAIDALGYEAKEFWPDLRRKLSRNH